MGKKRQLMDYDKGALRNLVVHLEKVRRPMPGSQIPRLSIDMEGLEKTIKGLPKKEREVMERFWGLIPGTPIRSQNVLKKIGKDTALKNMLEEAYHVMEKLISVEYLYQFDNNAKKLVEEIVSKIDKTGHEDMSDIDTIKYYLIFLVFLGSGHQMIYEADELQAMTKQEEMEGCFDKYALLQATWNCTTKYFPEKAINLRLIIATLEMFDLRDIITMKKYVFLPIDKGYEDVYTNPVGTFYQIRLFKEKIFSCGPWNVTSSLIYGHNVDPKDLEKFCKHFAKFRNDWNSLSDFKQEQEETFIATTKGKVIVPCYKIEKLEFTDSYEIISLYVNRNCLL